MSEVAAVGNMGSSTNPVVIASIHIPLDIIERTFRCKGLEAMAVANLCSLLVCGFLILFIMTVVWVELLCQNSS